jgi:hypothetical protein
MKRLAQIITLILLGVIIGMMTSDPIAILRSGKMQQTDSQKSVDYEHHWAKKYIDTAITNGYVSGYPDGSFKPDEPITRAAFAVIMDKSLIISKNNEQNISLTSYMDYAEIPEWAAAGIEKALRNGLIKPYSDNSVRPANPLITEDILALIEKEKLPAEILKKASSDAITRGEACVLIPILKENLFIRQSPL